MDYVSEGLLKPQVARKFDQSDAEGVLLRAGVKDPQANQWPGHTEESSTMDPNPDPTPDPSQDPTSDPIPEPAADPALVSAPHISAAPTLAEIDSSEGSPPSETECGAAEERVNDVLVVDSPQKSAAGDGPLSEDADLEVGSITAGVQ